MRYIYLLILNGLFALLTIRIYLELKRASISCCCVAGISLVYVVYRTMISSLIVEPFTIVALLTFFAVTILLVQKNVRWLFLFVAFLIANLLLLLASLLSVMIIIVLWLESEILFALVGISCSLVVFAGAMLLIQFKKVDLATFGQLLEKKSIKKTVTPIGILIIMLYSLINVGVRFIAYEDIVFSVVFGTATLVITITIVCLTISTIKHLNVERKNQQELQDEKSRLEQEQTTIQAQLAELDDVYESLKDDFGKVTSNYHNYKYSLPVLLSMQQKLLDELDQFAMYSNAEKSKWIREYAKQFNELSFDVSHDFIDDQVKTEVASIDLPASRLQLVTLIEKLMTTAQRQEVYLHVENQIQKFEDVDIPDIVLLRLISNIVDNAIKETCKIPKEKRGEVRLIFKEIDGYFAFEVNDYANEFDLSVLQKLGARKNSTNGTGDGYAEIMATLQQAQASLIIKEWQKRNRIGKTITVVFDGFEMRLLDSNYRQEVLQTALVDSLLEVL